MLFIANWHFVLHTQHRRWRFGAVHVLTILSKQPNYGKTFLVAQITLFPSWNEADPNNTLRIIRPKAFITWFENVVALQSPFPLSTIECWKLERSVSAREHTRVSWKRCVHTHTCTHTCTQSDQNSTTIFTHQHKFLARSTGEEFSPIKPKKLARHKHFKTMRLWSARLQRDQNRISQLNWNSGFIQTSSGLHHAFHQWSSPWRWGGVDAGPQVWHFVASKWRNCGTWGAQEKKFVRTSPTLFWCILKYIEFPLLIVFEGSRQGGVRPGLVPAEVGFSEHGAWRDNKFPWMSMRLNVRFKNNTKNSSMELAVIWGNFSCSDLAYSDLAHSDLAHSDLACSDLAHSDLAHSDLAHSDLARSDLGRFFIKILTFFT